MSSDNSQTGTDENGFLSRWSKRKEAAREASTLPLDEAVGSTDQSLAESSEPIPEPAELTDADMPDLETLRPDSDVSGFFSPGVSDALRRKALRKLFHTSRFNIKDGLDDYDDDYRAVQSLGDTVTWDMQRQKERLAERKRLREQAEAQDEASAENANTEAESPTEAQHAEEAAVEAEVIQSSHAADDDSRASPPPSK